MMGTIAGSDKGDGVIATASAYDSMLHRDSRFWDIITARREENRAKKTPTTADDGTTDTLPEGVSPFYGPTIGRRREFAPQEVDGEEDASGDIGGEGGGREGSAALTQQKNAINSFSIGGELDFTEEGGGGGVEGEDGKSGDDGVAATKSESAKVPKKDDLMDALMAIDDDFDGEEENSLEDNDSEMEEIVFETDDGSGDDVDVMEEEVTIDTVEGAIVAQESEASVPIQVTASTTSDADEEEGTTSSISSSASLADDKSSTQDKPNMAVDLDEDASLVQVKIEEGSEDVPDSNVSPDQDFADIGTGTESFDIASPVNEGSFDFDAEDEDLEDLENFLIKAGEK